MKVRGLRGAITVSANQPDEIFSATSELMAAIIDANHLDVNDVASVILTMTSDLTAAFPARAVRARQGWEWVPLMCARELEIEGSLPLCIRVLLHVNTEKEQNQLQHIYLRNAQALRPDLIQSSVFFTVGG